MSNVAVEKCHNSGTLPETLWQKMNAIADEIRQRAFGSFERRGRTIGLDLDDWLQAEREVVWSPTSELVDDDEGVQSPYRAARIRCKRHSSVRDAGGARHTGRRHPHSRGQERRCLLLRVFGEATIPAARLARVR